MGVRPSANGRNDAIANHGYCKGEATVPRGDRTGPASLGPMNASIAGCGAGRGGPGYVNLVPRRGFWGWARGRGRGRGKRRGAGQRMGSGRGLGRGMGRGRGMMPSPGASLPLPIDNEEVSAPMTLPPPAFRSGNGQELEARRAQARATGQKPGTINEKVSQIQAGRRRPLVATVDTTRCTGCAACIAVCPMGVITVDAVASIDTSNCAGCGLCVDECLQQAITLKKA